MTNTLTRIRSRTGSWNTFERRFKPRVDADGSLLVDLLPPDGVHPNSVWTITEVDGRLYVNAGFRFFNRCGFVISEVPWTDDDTRQPPYRYD